MRCVVAIAFWIFFGFIGSTCSSISLVVNLILYLENDSDSAYTDSLAFPMIFLPIFGIATMILYRKLKSTEFPRPATNEYDASINRNSTSNVNIILELDADKAQHHPLFLVKLHYLME